MFIAQVIYVYHVVTILCGFVSNRVQPCRPSMESHDDFLNSSRSHAQQTSENDACNSSLDMTSFRASCRALNLKPALQLSEGSQFCPTTAFHIRVNNPFGLSHSPGLFFHSVSKMSQTEQPAIKKPPPRAKADWSATQYLKFGNERTRAVHDLVAQLPFSNSNPPKHIVDLGCGPGNSTAVLAACFPTARISGVDSSPDMLARARGTLPGVEFSQGDVRTWSFEPDGDGPVDLLFSNAVFHWLRRADRIPTVLRLLRSLPGGGVLAFQMPDNRDEPSHAAMRDAAAAAGTWREYFAKLDGEKRPDLDAVESPAEWYDALAPESARVDIWHMLYQHVLPEPADIVEWVKGTGLQPFLNALPEGPVREAYLAEYERRLRLPYPRLADGKVMLRYPRLFVVAVRK